MFSWRYLTLLLACLLVVDLNVDAFVAQTPVAMPSMTTAATMPSKLAMIPQEPSMTLSAATVDPTSFLSDLFGNVIGTPLILAIPIVAALGVASLVVFLIVSYANPAEPDE